MALRLHHGLANELCQKATVCDIAQMNLEKADGRARCDWWHEVRKSKASPVS